MTNFEIFEKQFKEDYESIYDFIDTNSSEHSTIPYNGELKANKDNIEHDSYGNEDSTLSRVYYFGLYDLYVEFYGYRNSYSGEEWEGMKQVFLTTKTINVYE